MKRIMFFMLIVSSFLFSTITIGSGQTRFDYVKKDKWKYYKIHVDKGDKISISVNNISTDVDVFYRINAKPTRRYQNDKKYLCSWKDGNEDEHCSKVFNRKGNVYIGVNGFKKSSYKIQVRRTKSGLPNVLNGQSKSSYVNRGEWKYYILNGSKGEEVSATFTSISNRAYLYMQKGSLPTRSSRSYACKAKRVNLECKVTTSFNSNEPIYIGVYGRKNSNFSFKIKTKKLISPILLTSNSSKSGSVERKKIKYYKIDLKPHEKLSSVITKASSRKYIYVKIGQMPTTGFFDARSSKHGREAIVTNNTKNNKTAYIGVYGRYAGDFNIKVLKSSPKVLIANKVVSDSAKRREFKYYKISGSQNDTINITLNNCSSKKYLYVKVGKLPTGRKAHDDCRIKGRRATKECSIKLTKNDTVYIAVDGRNGGSFDIKASNGISKNAKEELINTLIGSIVVDEGQKKGQCKAYLQKKFHSISDKFKGTNSEELSMPQNTSWAAKSWKNNGGYAFNKIALYQAGKTKSTNAKNIKTLLKQAKKGDFIQMYWNPSSSKPLLTPHTILLLDDVSENTNLNWADSNLDGDEIVHTGTSYPWNSTKSFQGVVGYLSNGYCTNTCGATLYRLTDKIQKK